MATLELEVNGETTKIEVRDPDEPLLHCAAQPARSHWSEVRRRPRPMRRVHRHRRRAGHARQAAPDRSRRATAGASARGGEASSTPVAAALAHAVHDACGARLRTVPFTPQRVREAMA